MLSRQAQVSGLLRLPLQVSISAGGFYRESPAEVKEDFREGPVCQVDPAKLPIQSILRELRNQKSHQLLRALRPPLKRAYDGRSGT